MTVSWCDLSATRHESFTMSSYLYSRNGNNHRHWIHPEHQRVLIWIYLQAGAIAFSALAIHGRFLNGIPLPWWSKLTWWHHHHSLSHSRRPASMGHWNISLRQGQWAASSQWFPSHFWSLTDPRVSILRKFSSLNPHMEALFSWRSCPYFYSIIAFSARTERFGPLSTSASSASASFIFFV